MDDLMLKNKDRMVMMIVMIVTIAVFAWSFSHIKETITESLESQLDENIALLIEETKGEQYE